MDRKKQTKSPKYMKYTQAWRQILQLNKDDEILLGGDFNAKLKADSSKDTQEESSNGRILRGIATNTKLVPLNLKRDNVAWIRVNRKNSRKICDRLSDIRG